MTSWLDSWVGRLTGGGKESKLKPDGRLRWFGKLPSYADYYSSPADADWAQEFNEWILGGYELFHRRREASAPNLKAPGLPKRRLPFSECILRLPKSGMTVFASIQDYGGDMMGRHFPMCFYVGVPTELWPGPAVGQIVSAARVLRDLSALRSDVVHFMRFPGRFEQTFSDRRIDLECLSGEGANDDWLKEVAGVTLAEWFNQAGGKLAEENPDVWFALADAWGRNIKAHDAEEFQPTFRFPLVARLRRDAQVAAWLYWLGRRMQLDGRLLSLVCVGEPASIAAAVPDVGGDVTVLAREMVQEDFLLLTPLAETLSYVDDLSRVEVSEQQKDGGPDGEEVVEEGARPRLEKNWADFVQQAP